VRELGLSSPQAVSSPNLAIARNFLSSINPFFSYPYFLLLLVESFERWKTSCDMANNFFSEKSVQGERFVIHNIILMPYIVQTTSFQKVDAQSNSTNLPV